MQLIRKSAGLTQAQVAEKSGLSLSVLKKYETDVNQIGGGALLKWFSINEFAKYSSWFLTDHVRSDEVQVMPNSSTSNSAVSDENETLSQEEFDQEFVKTVADSLLMFCHLGWFEPNTDKVDFDDCGKLVLKDVTSLLNKMPHHQQNLHLIDKTG